MVNIWEMRFMAPECKILVRFYSTLNVTVECYVIYQNFQTNSYITKIHGGHLENACGVFLWPPELKSLVKFHSHIKLHHGMLCNISKISERFTHCEIS